MSVHFSSTSDLWLTPRPLLARVLAALGGTIELDPCSNSGVPRVPAERYLGLAEDGLAQPWQARSLFMNPPYGRAVGQWMAKLDRSHYARSVGTALALVPARTDTRWWQDHVAPHRVLFLRGRLTFDLPHPGAPPAPQEGAAAQARYAKHLALHLRPDPAPFPSALVCYGLPAWTLSRHFGDLGQLWSALPTGSPGRPKDERVA